MPCEDNFWAKALYSIVTGLQKYALTIIKRRSSKKQQVVLDLSKQKTIKGLNFSDSFCLSKLRRTKQQSPIKD